MRRRALAMASGSLPSMMMARLSAVGFDALLAGRLALVDNFAERALVLLVLGEAPFFVHSHEAEGEAGGKAESVLVGSEFV